MYEVAHGKREGIGNHSQRCRQHASQIVRIKLMEGKGIVLETSGYSDGPAMQIANECHELSAYF